MKINYRSYPHPVLSPFSDDLEQCAFQSSILTSVSSNFYELKVTSVTSCKDINKLIQENMAQFALHVECAGSRFRQLFVSSEREFKIKIPSESLDGRVELCPFIIAKEDIKEYKSDYFHKDYESRPFQIKKGDVLAIEKDKFFYAEKELDPLKKISSIFTVKKNEDKNAAPLEVDTNNEKIYILLNSDNYNNYRDLRQSQDIVPVLSQMTIYPALVMVLEQINSAKKESGIPPEMADLRWFRSIAKKMKDINIDVMENKEFNDTSVAIAGRLIGDPLTLALKVLLETEND